MLAAMWRRVAIAVALTAIVAYSFALRWQILDATPFPTGIDGYFYPVQLRALLTHGHLQYPASPLAFWFMAPFAAATDPIIGAKLGAAIGGALIALPAYLLGARIGRGWGAGLLAASLATFSAGSTYLTIEYVKNGIGLTVALAALWLVLRAIETPSRGRLITAVLAIVAAILAHKMAAAIVIAIGAPAALAAAIGRGVLRGRRLIYVIAGASAALLVALIVGTLAPRRFVSPEDLRLVRGLFSSHAEWELPALALKGYVLDLGHEALVGAILAVGAAAALVLGPRLAPAERTVAWGSVVLGLAIAIPVIAVDDPQGLGFRLRLVAFVPRALCAAILCGALPFPASASRRSLRDVSCAAIALVIALAAPREDHIDGEIDTHPALVTSALALSRQIPAGATAIVPERHIEYMIAWYADVAVSAQPGSIPRDQRWRVLPGNFIHLGSPLDKALMAARAERSIVAPIGVHPRHPNGMVLVTEPTWEWLLARLPPADRKHFAAWITK